MAAATFIAVGKMSLEDCPKLTCSCGCTERRLPSPAPSNSDALLASTSFMFILVCVPEPVCQMDNGNSSSQLPAKTSSAAVMIAAAVAGASNPRSRLTIAATRLTCASANTNSRGIRSLEIEKCAKLRCVCAPQSRFVGTSIRPKLSLSDRNKSTVCSLCSTLSATYRVLLVRLCVATTLACCVILMLYVKNFNIKI